MLMNPMKFLFQGPKPTTTRYMLVAGVQESEAGGGGMSVGGRSGSCLACSRAVWLQCLQPVLLRTWFPGSWQARMAGRQLPDPDYPNSLAPRFLRYLTRFETNADAYDIFF